MALTTVLSVNVRPDRASAYEAHVHELANQARAKKEPLEWATYQVTAGRIGTMHFVSQAPDWTTFAAREPIEIFVRRVMGDSDGMQLLDRLAECVLSERFVIGRERPDLSCPVPPDAPRRANSMVTLMRTRPGGEDACEELIRKVAQAVPLVGDPRRYMAYETFIGQTRTYWIVTPLEDVAQLDRILSPQELLAKAFGAEGVLIHRTGLEAIENMERQLTVLRPELSNATWLGNVVGLREEQPAARHAKH